MQVAGNKEQAWDASILALVIIVFVAVIVLFTVQRSVLQSSLASLTCGGGGGSAYWAPGTATASECGNGTSASNNACTVALVNPAGFCSRYPRPATAACTSACHVAGAVSAHCDPATSDCVVDNPAECKGYCTPATAVVQPYSNISVGTNSSCAAHFPVWPGLEWDGTIGHLTPNMPLFAALDATNNCVGHQCVRVGLLIAYTVRNYSLADPMYPGEYMTCEEVLDPARVDVSCIETRTMMLGDLFLSSYFEALYNQTTFYDGTSNYHPLYLAKLCSYRYACASFDWAWTGTTSTSTSTSTPSLDDSRFFQTRGHELMAAMLENFASSARGEALSAGVAAALAGGG